MCLCMCTHARVHTRTRVLCAHCTHARGHRVRDHGRVGQVVLCEDDLNYVEDTALSNLKLVIGFAGVGSSGVSHAYPAAFPKNWMITGGILGHAQALINPYIYGLRWRDSVLLLGGSSDGLQVAKTKVSDEPTDATTVDMTPPTPAPSAPPSPPASERATTPEGQRRIAWEA